MQGPEHLTCRYYVYGAPSQGYAVGCTQYPPDMREVIDVLGHDEDYRTADGREQGHRIAIRAVVADKQRGTAPGNWRGLCLIDVIEKSADEAVQPVKELKERPPAHPFNVLMRMFRFTQRRALFRSHRLSSHTFAHLADRLLWP